MDSAYLADGYCLQREACFYLRIRDLGCAFFILLWGTKKQCPNHPWFPADWMESREYTAEAHSPREIAKGSNVPLVYLPTAQTDGRFWPKGNPKVYRHMVFAC